MLNALVTGNDGKKLFEQMRHKNKDHPPVCETNTSVLIRTGSSTLAANCLNVQLTVVDVTASSIMYLHGTQIRASVCVVGL